VIVEAPFFFSIAALSASLAGLAGLVAGLRRGSDMPGPDLFRLREIVEFSFANVLLAVSTIPLAVALGTLNDAVRVGAVAAVIYLLAVIAILRMRQQRLAVAPGWVWYAAVLLLNAAALVAALTTIATGAVPAYEALLVILLARPMLAFLLVLQSFEGQ
jgi:hypothetical protein